jgi:hypothetical protein
MIMVSNRRFLIRPLSISPTMRVLHPFHRQRVSQTSCASRTRVASLVERNDAEDTASQIVCVRSVKVNRGRTFALCTQDGTTCYDDVIEAGDTTRTLRVFDELIFPNVQLMIDIMTSIPNTTT